MSETKLLGHRPNYLLPEEELLLQGHVACPGCGASLSMRYALKALGKQTVVVIPACCWSIIAGPFPYSSLEVPIYHTAFETTGALCSGVRAALQILGKKDITVMGWAGDGGTFDIGIQALSGAVERNEDFIYVCYDNEAYMNTGIQRSSATPWLAWTTTTPTAHPKDEPKKDIVAIMAAHRIPYVATATVGFPEDMIRKFRKARSIRGAKFLHLLSPCPPGRRHHPPDPPGRAEQGLPALRGGKRGTVHHHRLARAGSAGAGIPDAPGTLPPPDRGAGGPDSAGSGPELGAAGETGSGKR